MRSALINATAACPEFRDKLGATYLAVDPDAVDIPENRFRDIDPNGIKDLANSISQVGLLEPVGIKLKTGGAKMYEVIYGARRVMACQLLMRTAIANSSNPSHDPEVSRFSEMHALRFPKDIPDHLIKILEIRENLDRQDLTSKERAIHTTKMVAYIKDLKDSYHSKCDNSDAPKNGRGRPVGIVQEAASEIGISPSGVRKRGDIVSELAGVSLDLEADSSETLHAAADAASKVVSAEKTKERSKGKSISAHLHPHSADGLINWFDKRRENGEMTMEDVCIYKDAIIEYCRRNKSTK